MFIQWVSVHENTEHTHGCVHSPALLSVVHSDSVWREQLAHMEEAGDDGSCRQDPENVGRETGQFLSFIKSTAYLFLYDLGICIPFSKAYHLHTTKSTQ